VYAATDAESEKKTSPFFGMSLAEKAEEQIKLRTEKTLANV
jgi:hypothetical protein